MKNQFNSRREQAVALIIVLAMLVLLSGLIVAFMNSVGNERAASVVNSNGLTSRQIAESTVNLVIGQIRQATSQAGADASTPTTWASQPGAIRTLSGSVGSSKAIANGASGVNQFTYKAGSNDYIFKLYSADKMKIPTSDINGKAWDTAETQVIETWKRNDPAKDATYVDLNEPVLSPLPASVTGNNPNIVEPRYPIIDPRAKFGALEAATSAADPGVVDGFDIKTTGLADPTLKFISKDKTGKKGANVPVQYLPMPVKWLYVMRDGSMSAANDTSGKIVGASAQNPIIGRTAFWADDESCKLNINTASEGTFWDTPTVAIEQESGNVDGSKVVSSSPSSLGFAAAQPARGEFQRYPGHPATTCLSPVLGWLWGILPKDAPRPTRDLTLLTMKDGINAMAPFSPFSYHAAAAGLPPVFSPAPANSTSMGGSYNPDREVVTVNEVDPLTGLTRPKAQQPLLAVTTKHLYATVDEYIFAPNRIQTNATTPTTLNNPNLNPDSLEKVRFFLTANSRAPELNLFGRPRVTFWPISAREELRTSFDDLFAFSSTLYKDPNGNRANDNIFYFTRYDAKDRQNDFNTNLSGEPPNKNQKIFKYLQLMTGDGAFNKIPGFGGNFATKYPVANGFSERDQILTEIFDYCRTVNMVDTSTRNRVGAYRPYTPFFGGTLGGQYNAQADRSTDWSGQVTPIRTSDPDSKAGYQGLGRFATITEAAIVFYRYGTNPVPKPPDPAINQLQATLLFEMSTPMPGLPAIRETYWTRVTVDRPTTVDGATVDSKLDSDIQLVGAPGQARINIVNVPAHDATDGRGYMPTLGFLNQMNYYQEPTKWTDIFDPGRPKPNWGSKPTRKKFSWDGTDPNTDSTLNGNYKRSKSITFYPYVSKMFSIEAAKQLKFKGGAYTVEIFAGEAPDDDRNPGQNTVPVQTIHLNFPVTEVAVVAPTGGADLFETRVTGNLDSGWEAIHANDIVRSIEYVGPAATLNQQGDLRLGMCRREVPDTYYQPRSPGAGAGKYGGTDKLIHGLTVSHGDPYTGYVTGTRSHFAAGGTDRGSKPAILPVGIDGVQNSVGGPGDYERGLSKHYDMSGGGKVDEGNVWYNYGDNNDGGRLSYFRGRGVEETGQSNFSPNRQLASAVQFGLLPTGVVRGLPWQTLLFRPDRGLKPHPGGQTASNPADHLLLDLFNLPVVEPYAISEAFSSGGKVNLNYVIAPFGYAAGDGGKYKENKMARSYLRRDTALRGVFKSVKMAAVPTNIAEGGHWETPVPQGTGSYLSRFDIDADKTLDQFEDRFKDPSRGLFRSASEICDMDLYPVAVGSFPKKPTNWATFWDTDYAQTGDNLREKPYAHIYPRVTTKSNTYTVHMRCQAIKKAVGTAPDVFDTAKDKVLGEYRGSATIERFVDPNDPELEKYDATSASSSVDKFYRFRIVSTKQFLPR